MANRNTAAAGFEKIRKPNRDKDFEYTYKKKVEVKMRRAKKNKYALREKE